MSRFDVSISQVEQADITEVIDFVMASRAQIFPMLDATVLPADLQHFERVYLSGEDGRFWLARSEGEIVAAIGYLPYDHRFAQLDYAGRRTVEIVRLFVAPQFRRFGLAKALYERLREHAAAAGVQVLYLHTHPFLRGAIRFWERQGFVVVDVEADPLWQTTHMQFLLPDLS
ncbi:GNAT family N-acetyltransferase [Pseudomonas sp. MM211]|uniref:GNAT family N-acetyltransferase n=1 Tax=Pseudomonas sp. MM211 TaxID=2866808 RepID=UPI001CEE0664|nr:GNAT family N-acetyltransferase [Pseudomonas sp. MM211]UCJ15000.1 GNAT family N-acetyltransferase [Pseudomonas sp. MM211]